MEIGRWEFLSPNVRFKITVRRPPFQPNVNDADLGFTDQLCRSRTRPARNKTSPGIDAAAAFDTGDQESSPNAGLQK